MAFKLKYIYFSIKVITCMTTNINKVNFHTSTQSKKEMKKQRNKDETRKVAQMIKSNARKSSFMEVARQRKRR